MATLLHVLILEDRPADVELVLERLRLGGFEPDWHHVVTEAEYRTALDPALDVILADYCLPDLDALRALHLLQESGLDIPFIVITGSVGEELAVECIKEGAADYLLKDRLARLGPAVTHALEQKRFRQEKRWAEEALRRSEERFQLIVRATNDAVWDWNLLTDELWWGTGFRTLFGYREEEIEPGIESWYSRIHPDDRERVVSGIHALIRSGGETWSGEHRYRRADGSYAHVIDRGYVIHDDEGTPVRMVGAMVDVTKRKQAEEALQKHVERLDALRQVGLEITAELDLDSLLRSIVSRAVQLLRGASGGLYLHRPERDLLEWTVAAGPRMTPVGHVLHRGEGLSGRVWETGVPLLVDDYRCWEGRAATFEDYPFTAVVGVPVRWGDEFLGVLNVMAEPPRTFTSADAELLGLFATQAAIAIRNARLFGEVSEHRERLRALAARLAEVEETERRRLARELHDRVGQNLTALNLNLNVARSQLPAEVTAKVGGRLEDAVNLVAATAECIRDVMGELRPPVLDDYGLLAALRWYGEQLSARTGVAVFVRGEEAAPRLAPAVETALFRIAQEALTNVARHAQAGKAAVVLRPGPRRVRLTIADDGIGFDPHAPLRPGGPRGWGLINIQERAEAVGGRLRLESAPGRGTRLTVEVAR